jgi:hypothetical protein
MSPAADEDKYIDRPIRVHRVKMKAVGSLLSSAEGQVAINHLSPVRGRRMDGAGVSVHFEITGSQEPDAVGACMRVRKFNFNVHLRASRDHSSQNWPAVALT